jgi:hypothetical protein
MSDLAVTAAQTATLTATIREWATITKTLTWTAAANVWVTQTATLTALERSRTTSTTTRTVKTHVWATETATWEATKYVCTTTTATRTINGWATAIITPTITDFARAVTTTITPTITVTVPATTVTSLTYGTPAPAPAKEGLTYILSLVKAGNLSVAMLVLTMVTAVVFFGAILSMGYHLCGAYKTRGRLGAPVLDDVTAACEKAVGFAEELEKGDGGIDRKQRPAAASAK